jgi:hypothetical protein
MLQLQVRPAWNRRINEWTACIGEVTPFNTASTTQLLPRQNSTEFTQCGSKNPIAAAETLSSRGIPTKKPHTTQEKQSTRHSYNALFISYSLDDV